MSTSLEATAPSIELTYGGGSTVLAPSRGRSKLLAAWIMHLYNEERMDSRRIVDTINGKGFRTAGGKRWSRTAPTEIVKAELGRTLSGSTRRFMGRKPRAPLVREPLKENEREAAATLELVEYTVTFKEVAASKRLEMIRRIVQ